jgi:hypothetical protein
MFIRCTRAADPSPRPPPATQISHAATEQNPYYTHQQHHSSAQRHPYISTQSDLVTSDHHLSSETQVQSRIEAVDAADHRASRISHQQDTRSRLDLCSYSAPAVSTAPNPPAIPSGDNSPAAAAAAAAAVEDNIPGVAAHCWILEAGWLGE